MEGTYLFFDIECANNINAEGYICSFGYVLCDAQFNIIESRDIVMNPRAAFDDMLLTPGSRCLLAYSKDYFLQQPDFSFYYTSIRELLTAPGRTPIGFAVENDIDFMVCACKHFGKEQIHFAAYDSHTVAHKASGEHHGLGDWMAFYHLDTAALTAHNSRDDAMMTLLLLKEVCRRQGLTLPQLLEQSGYALRSVQQTLENRRLRAYRRYMNAQIKALDNQRHSSPASRRLRGRYKLGLNAQRDLEQKYEIAKLIYDNGGVLVSKLTAGCTFVMEDERPREEWMDSPRSAAVRFLRLRELYAKVGLEEPPFKEQSRDVPDLEEQFSQYVV